MLCFSQAIFFRPLRTQSSMQLDFPSRGYMSDLDHNFLIFSYKFLLRHIINWNHLAFCLQTKAFWWIFKKQKGMIRLEFACFDRKCGFSDSLVVQGLDTGVENASGIVSIFGKYIQYFLILILQLIPKILPVFWQTEHIGPNFSKARVGLQYDFDVCNVAWNLVAVTLAGVPVNEVVYCQVLVKRFNIRINLNLNRIIPWVNHIQDQIYRTLVTVIVKVVFIDL